MAPPTGAHIIARSLRDLGVTVVFGIIGNANVNAFPLLLLAGSSETNLVSRGAFQEFDAISLLTPHTKLARRPPSINSTPHVIQDTYRTSWYGRLRTGFVDLPAYLVKGVVQDTEDVAEAAPVPDAPKGGVEEARLFNITHLIKSAKAPLVVIGKGAAYARAEGVIRDLIDKTNLPFLPTPMGKASLPIPTPLIQPAHEEADVVLILGARLNWILHFGDAPKWDPVAQFIQVDISAEEIGRNSGNPELGTIGDIGIVVPQLTSALGSWSYPTSTPYIQHLSAAKSKNEATAASKASNPKSPMTYAHAHAHAFTITERTLHSLSPPDDAGIVYVSEGANTMDISRSIFPVSHPRLRLDAGTYATMGVGLGYAIAAHAAYNGSAAEGRSGPRGRRNVVSLEGDRYGMDILIFVVNNGGIYHGDSDDAES
ncbi:MAG: hypothetical protein Q9175_008030 [Cornicularia normoerica]